MILLFDIGGTKTRFGVSEDGVSVSDVSVISTPTDFQEAMKVFFQGCGKIVSGRNVEVAAGGVAGVLDDGKNALAKSPNLSGWENKPLKKDLEEMFKCKVLLENDANLAGLGEAITGAGKGFQSVVFITVGTGIGGTRILNGKIDEYIYGFEPGHQYVDVGASITGQAADLEELVAGSGIKKRFGVPPEEMKDDKVWEEATKYLAYGLHNTILHWSPEIIVLGGGLIISGAISIDRLKVYLSDILKIFPRVPEISKSKFGDVAGLHGALQYSKKF